MWKRAAKNGYNKPLIPIIPQLRPTQLASTDIANASKIDSFLSIVFELSTS